MTQIPAFDPIDTALRGEQANGFGAMKSEDFIRIIFTELANQDPFQPNDSSALLDQLNSIRQIESNIDLMERMEGLVFQNKLASAAGMTGKYIEGLTATNDTVGGTVISVHRNGDDVNLELDSGWIVPIDGVKTITDLRLLEPVEPPAP